jgi:hypothetical protein
MRGLGYTNHFHFINVWGAEEHIFFRIGILHYAKVIKPHNYLYLYAWFFISTLQMSKLR